MNPFEVKYTVFGNKTVKIDIVLACEYEKKVIALDNQRAENILLMCNATANDTEAELSYILEDALKAEIQAVDNIPAALKEAIDGGGITL